MKHHIDFDLEFFKHNYPGKFIVLEGVDGSGKTTHSKELVKLLEKEGKKVIYTKEPTNGVIGQLARQILSGEVKVPPVSLQYLFSADRAVHQEEIIKYLKEGYVVISDRYFWSAVAFGAADIGENVDNLIVAYSILSMYNRFLSPDIAFLLDVSENEAVKRISKSDKHTEIYDRREIIAKTRKIYLSLAERFKEEFTIIDAGKPLDDVSKELLNKIKELVK